MAISNAAANTTKNNTRDVTSAYKITPAPTNTTVNTNIQAAREMMKSGNTAGAQSAIKQNVNLTGNTGSAMGTPMGVNTNVKTAVAGANTTANRAISSQIPEGYAGMRDELNKRGIDVGWNDATKNVTYNGKDVYAPGVISNEGRSYASMADINNLTDDIYRQDGKNLVQATDYAQQSGLNNIVKWSEDGKVMVGGQAIKPVYVTTDGKAMVDEAELNAALESYKNTAGVMSDKDVYDDWYGKYNNRIQSALNKVVNREKWSYDPYSDPAYKAYRDQYMREGNRAYQDAYAQAAAMSGGYGSSIAATAGGQQLNYYQQQLNDRVPELMQNSYNRYLGEQDLNRVALEQIRAAGNDDYNKLYAANNDAYNRINEAAERAYERDIFERYTKPMYNEQINQARQQTKEGDIDLAYRDRKNQLELDNYDIQTRQAEENLRQSKVENAFARAVNIDGCFTTKTGPLVGFTAPDYPDYTKYPDTNGYPSPYSAEAQRALELWNNAEKPIALEQMTLGM